MARLNLTTTAAFARPSASQPNIGTATTLAFAIPIDGAGLLAAAAAGSNLLTVVGTAGAPVRVQVLAGVASGQANIALVDGLFGGGVFLTAATPVANIDSGTDYVIYVQTGAAGRVISVMELDGTVVYGTTGSATTIPNAGAANGRVWLGDSAIVDGFACSIDAVAIWNAAQVGTERYTPPTGSEPDLLSYVPFDEGAGTVAANVVSGAEDLDTLSATTWSVGGTWDGPAATLTVADCVHGHTADSPALTAAGTLVVQDAAHGHTADSLTLTGIDPVWGALGDSQTDEYRADDSGARGGGTEWEDTTLSWLELLAAPSAGSTAPTHGRNLNFGPWGTRAEPRRSGFEFNWARSSSVMDREISGNPEVVPDQVPGLAAQVSAGTVTHVVLFGTGNEWINYEPFYALDIYDSPDGGVTTGDGLDVATEMGLLADSYIACIDAMVSAGVVGMVVMTPTDYGITPVLFAALPDETRRGYISAAVADVRAQIASHIATVNATAGYTQVVATPTDDLLLTPYETADGTTMMVAGVELTYSSESANPLFFAVSGHMGTVGGGLFANTFIAAANQLVGVDVTPFTDQEIRENAGIASVFVAPADTAHAHTADSVALTQANVLTVQDAVHAHAAESPTLTQAHTLAVADTAHGHVAGSVALTQASTLAVADAGHGHAADAVSLTQAHTLSIADAAHGHTAESPALTLAGSLAVSDSLHTHTADALTLTQASQLVIQSALHAHTADSPALSVAFLLAVSDALHAHAAENPALSVAGALVVADALHAHAADSLALTQAHVLVVTDALHGHSADVVAFTTALDATYVIAIDGPGLILSGSGPGLIVAGNGPGLIIGR